MSTIALTLAKPILDMHYVRYCYQLLLERPIDAAAQADWQIRLGQKLQAGAIDFVLALVASEEFQQVHDSIDRLARDEKMKQLLLSLKLLPLTEHQWARLVTHLQLNRNLMKSEWTTYSPSSFMRQASKALGASKLYRKCWETSFHKRLRALPDYHRDYLRVRPFVRLHNARQAWVASLPKAARILDIGGSSPSLPEGALIELGYPYRPTELIIFDKPPAEQFWGLPGYEQGAPRQFDWGQVRYIHGYAEDLLDNQVLADEKFDMIFMGQVVEHIRIEGLPVVLRWIASHLNPGGQFFCDTPNRLITRVQMGESVFIDPDHKKEYQPSEVAQLMRDAGFTVTAQWGLLQMPKVVASQQFGREDYYSGELVCDNPDQGYCFATHGRVA
jgi:SAM-dependent methyltransferase